jgi:hypothetical protein
VDEKKKGFFADQRLNVFGVGETDRTDQDYD